MEERTKAFDQDLEERTQQGIQELRKRMEAEMNKKLEKQRLHADNLLRKMEQNYEDHHEEYVEKLFRSLTGV